MGWIFDVFDPFLSKPFLKASELEDDHEYGSDKDCPRAHLLRQVLPIVAERSAFAGLLRTQHGLVRVDPGAHEAVDDRRSGEDTDAVLVDSLIIHHRLRVSVCHSQALRQVERYQGQEG